MTGSRFDLNGRVAIVTGAAGGFGSAMATTFAQAGADLLLVDINEAGLQRIAGEVEGIGRRAVPVLCDILDLDQIRAAYAELDQVYGRIDVLANVAGPAAHGRPEDIPIEDVLMSLQGLVVGRFLMCQEAGKRMLKAGRGSIINIGSISSITALGRGHIAYSMAMGAVAQMTRELSTEWSGRGVRVNAILPAQVPNPGNGLNERIAADPELGRRFLRGIPAGRLGRPEEISGLALLLASDASSWITGALIPMDGGNLAKNAGGSHPGMP
jgi:NAD(P)-dependent dehydrogenase (short-subunit alcohol dehydrogenase family)